MSTAMHTPRSSSSATASARDPLLDLARSGALGVVVLWHWVFSTVEVNDTGLHVGNVLTADPWLWPLTWILQPMAIFFAVGGSLHLASWRRRPEQFVRRRFARLVVPTLPLLVPAAAIVILAGVMEWTLVFDATVLIISPLWFLGVYVILMTLVPVTATMHERHPLLTLAALGAAAAALDIVRFAYGWGGIVHTLAGFLVVWAAVHQFGYWWERLSAARPIVQLAVAGTGLAGLCILPQIGPYPLPMVGVPNQEVSNMAPPNLMTIMLALFQVGLLALAAAPLRRFAQRHGRGLSGAQAQAMPVFVWHLAGYTAFFVVATSVLGLQNDVIDLSWWLQRPIWFLGPAACTAAILWVSSGGPRRTLRRPRAPQGSPTPLG